MILWNCGAPPNAPQATAAPGQAAQSVPQVASGLVGCSEMQFSQLLLAGLLLQLLPLTFGLLSLRTFLLLNL
ncbi:hypothetical protein BIW11_06555 [Tropilaelaps mercedesae]|uniref:Uncharacterized protein n=1 Tax=Tropilaelaps mercedesae TaxID=418985 RepID=A0A1V9XXG3_9ACAR|nr:hypothetical protein BIW11_06555 [Tropilaelaps mercedesae]